MASQPQRARGSNKKNKESQAKVMNQLKEMFGSTFEPDIITSVAENCNWKMEPSIDALINMSLNVKTPQKSKPVYDPWELSASDEHDLLHDFSPTNEEVDLLNMGDTELQQQQEEMLKFEQAKRIETASLCGLKVQYRPRGVENNSDDDADVVIEEESSDYRMQTPELERNTNVCQFLSAPTQCPPQDTFPKVNYINTPSPPCSPQRQQSPTSQIESQINRGFKVLVLMRGVPGSGKSYLAKNIVQQTVGGDTANHVFSTDDYFASINRGVYKFDATRLSEAHEYNRNRVYIAIKQGWSPIIVDNTNTQVWEMQAYAEMAVQHGYIVETVEPDTPWSRKARELERRNVHGVPKDKIKMMLERYEDNISGERLLRMLRLHYASNCQPPQLRKMPPTSQTSAVESKLRNMMLADNRYTINPSFEGGSYSQKRMITQDARGDTSNSPLQQRVLAKPSNSPRRVRKPKKTNDNQQEPQRLIDNEALNTIAKEYATVDSDVIVKPLSTNESWTEGSSFKEESQLDHSKLGAIGSERRPVDGPSAIPDEQESSVLSNCWDYRLEMEDTENQYSTEKFNEDDSTIKETEPSEVSIDNKEFTKTNEDEIIDPEVWSSIPSDTKENIRDTNEEDDNTDVRIDDRSCLSAHPTQATLVSDIYSEKTEDRCSPIRNTSIEGEDKSSPTSEPQDTELIQISDISITSENINFVTPSTQVILEPKPTLECSNQSKTSETACSKTEASSIGPSTSSSNSSLEKVDVSQFDLYATSIADKSEDQDQATSGLVSIFSFIKNSFLGNEKEKNIKLPKLENCEKPSSSTPNKSPDHLPSTSTLNVSSAIVINPKSPSTSCTTRTKSEISSSPNSTDKLIDVSLDDEFFEARESVTEPSHVIEEMLLEASSDFQLVEQLDFTERKVDNAVTEKTFIEPLKNLQVLPKSEEDEDKVSKEPIDKLFGSKNVFPEKIQNDISSVDNVNLISWRESPFPLPLDEQTEPQEEKTTKKVEMKDTETFTDPYDFNVAYIGGIDDYKVLVPVNRDINEGYRMAANDSRSSPLLKLLLDKGTMTSSTRITKMDELFDPKDDADDRSDEIIERFSLLPRALVVDVYKNLCQSDFDWTCDHLNNLQQDEASINAAVDQLDADLTDWSNLTDTNVVVTAKSSSSSSSPLFSPEQQTPTNCSKKKKLQSDPDCLALKQQIESKFIINEDSYQPHTLRVKRWKRREFETTKKVGNEPKEPKDQQIGVDFLSVLDNNKINPFDLPAEVEDCEDRESVNSDSFGTEEGDEIMELKLGYDFIKVLETEFGNPNFQTPDGLFPVIQIKKSMAQELYALWVESTQQQLWAMQEQLDALITKDAEFARSLQQEEVEEKGKTDDQQVPNLKEIMEMEMALATYNNDFKRKKESFKDMEFRVTENTLHDLFPDHDRKMLFEIYEAHGRDLDETLKIIKENCEGRSTTTMADVLKKQKNLIDKLQKESSYQTSRYNQMESEQGFDEACGGDYIEYDEYSSLTYEDAIETAKSSRVEARRQLELRNLNYQKASEYCRRKKPEIAAYYSGVAKLHMRNVEVANSTAASAFLAAQAHELDSNDKLDLHHLHATEAIQALDIFLSHHLDIMAKGTRKIVYIITGRGARSSNGRSILKPTIARKLHEKNYRYTEGNPGMLKVFLRKK